MLALTKKSEYALVAVCHLAGVGKRVVSAREIAEQHMVPLPLLMNVLKKLGQAGHVRSTRGARGGYRLTVSPEQLSLAAVICAVEGPLRFVNCLPGRRGIRDGCARVEVCTLRSAMHRVHERLFEFLDGVTVASLVFDRERAAAQSSPDRERAIAR